MKKRISLLMALALCLAALTAFALAEDVASAPVDLVPGEEETLLPGGDAASEGYADFVGEVSAEEGTEEFVIEDENGTLMEYNGPGGDVIIPDTVTDISSSAFNTYGSMITSLEVPGSVKYLRSSTFRYCKNLEKVILRDGVKEIGSSVFAGLPRLNSVTIPASVTIIDSFAFQKCPELTEVSLQEGLTAIKDSAFLECGKLKGVLIPKSVTSIGAHAFENCTSLKSVSIPSGVKYIQEATFAGCEALSELKIAKGVESIDYRAFENCRSLKKVTVPDTVARIYGAFKGCEQLSEVILSDGVGALYGTFMNCKSLKAIVIPGSVTTIGSLSFMGCEALAEVAISDGVKTIGTNAFANCKTLKSVTIPSSVQELDEEIFSGCDSLTTLKIKKGVSFIPEAAFKGCARLKSVSIPASVTSIEKSAFSGCKALTKLTLKEGLQTIENEAFKGCKALTEVALPKSLRSIPTDAFKGCTAATVTVEGNCEALQQAMDLTSVKVVVLPSGMNLDTTKATLVEGEKLAVSAEIWPEEATTKLTYKSANKKVATVKKGVITAVAAGSTKITVTTVNGISKKVSVTVLPLPKKVKLNKTGTVTLIADGTLQLKGTVSPKNAPTRLKWKSKNKKIASVSNTGLVTALKKGSTTITVTTDNGKKASVKIKVKSSLSELSGILTKKVSAINKKLGDKLKKATWRDGVYENKLISVDVDAKGRIVSIDVPEAAGKKYKVFGIYPGMKKSTALKKLKDSGHNLGLDMPTMTYFANKKDQNRLGWITCTSTGKVLTIHYYLSQY